MPLIRALIRASSAARSCAVTLTTCGIVATMRSMRGVVVEAPRTVPRGCETETFFAVLIPGDAAKDVADWCSSADLAFLKRVARTELGIDPVGDAPASGVA